MNEQKISSKEIQGRGIRFSVDDQGKEVGHAYLYVFTNDFDKEPFGFLEDVFIDESMRGKGIGTMLMKNLLERAKTEGCYKIVAGSRHSRPEVHEFYRRLGFADHGVEFRIDLKPSA